MFNDQNHDVTLLNSLITTTIDSALGYEESAEAVDSPRFSEMFRDYAAERRQVVGLLQEQVRAFGGTPEDDGSIKAAAHRRWVDFRDAVSGRGDKEVIEEVERGEDYIKAKYEAALRDDELSVETRGVIERAFESVRSGHDRASALKHSMEGTA